MTWRPWLHQRLIGMPHGPDPGMLGRRTALFNRPAAPLRPMIVMVDARLRDRVPHDPKVTYLLELLAGEPIQAHLYSAEGPPAHARRVTAAATGIEGVKEWVLLHATEDGESLDAIYLKDGVPTRVQTQATDPVYLHLSTTPPVNQVATDDARDQVRADALALLAAKAMRADLFITDRPLLVDPASDFWWTTTVMQPEMALPVVGLYLRQQGKFVFARSPGLGAPAARVAVSETDLINFYWQAAQDLLPAAARWEAACKAYPGATDDETLSALPTALTWRLDQVLRARDRLLATLALVPRDHSPADEALTELDQILLWLMAALDVTAQVAHVALRVPMKSRNAMWQSEGWLNKVAEEDETLANLVRNESEGAHVLTILRELRNSIHGEGLSVGGTTPVVGEQALQVLVRLPRRRRKEVLKAIDALDGFDLWGVVRPSPDRDLHLHAGTFVEQLLPRVLSLLNAVIAATPVDRLLSEDADPARLPKGRHRSLFDQRTRWQLGW